MKYNIVIFCLLIGSSLFGQEAKRIKADKFYEKLAYSRAVTLYEDLLGSEEDTPELKSKLAMSYYKIGDTYKAAHFFRQMILTDEAVPEDYYYYAQALKQNGDYETSDEWMAKFHKRNATDSRGERFSVNEDYLSDIYDMNPLFAIQHLDINTSSSEFGGYVGPDGKSVYFLSSRSRRSFVSNRWSWSNKYFLELFEAQLVEDNGLKDPKELSKVNTKFHEGPLCFSSDGKFVYYTRNNIAKKRRDRKDASGIQNLKLYRSQIGTDGKWYNEEVLPFCSKDYSVGHPSISKDGSILYFASDMPGGLGGSDIYKVTINSDGTFGNPVNLGSSINTEGREMFPWVNNDGDIFFSSDGQLGLGGLDVFGVVADGDGGFSKPVNLGIPINSKKDDFAFAMTSDGKTGFFSSNRGGGKGEDDIYSFTQLRDITIGKRIKGLAYDTEGSIVPGVLVKLYDQSGNVVSTSTSNADGSFEFQTPPDEQYKLYATKDDYFDGESTVSTATSENEVSAKVVLEKDPGISLYAIITDKKTGKPIEGVTLTIIDNMSGNQQEVTTSKNGDYRRGLADKKMNDRGSYNFTLEKEGYFSKTVTYNTLFDKPGQYDVHSALDFSMDPEVKDLSEMVVINPINFDLGSARIRPDAALELDKIVEIMNKYPDMVVELGAHTDCRGSIRSNELLSEKRAKASADYIQRRISDPDRIFGKGYGESRPVNGCVCEGRQKSDCSEEEHAKNRRTEFKVVSTGNDKVKAKSNESN